MHSLQLYNRNCSKKHGGAPLYNALARTPIVWLNHSKPSLAAVQLLSW